MTRGLSVVGARPPYVETLGNVHDHTNESSQTNEYGVFDSAVCIAPHRHRLDDAVLQIPAVNDAAASRFSNRIW